MPYKQLGSILLEFSNFASSPPWHWGHADWQGCNDVLHAARGPKAFDAVT
jgi:hypothetical protein